MHFLYSALSYEMLRALYTIITPTGLCNPAPSQLPGKHTNVSRTQRASTLNNLTRSVICLWPGTHFKYCWVDRGKQSETPFPRVKRTSWGQGRTHDLLICRQTRYPHS